MSIMNNPIISTGYQPQPFSLTPFTDDATAIQQAQNKALQTEMAGVQLAEQQRQQERLIAKQKAFESEFDSVIQTSGHDPKALIKLSMKYPGMLDESLMAQVSAQEKQALIKTASPIYNAAINGAYDIAATKAEQTAKAMAESDPETAQTYQEVAQALRSGDEKVIGYALDQAQGILISAMGVDNFKKQFDINMEEKKFGVEEKEAEAGIEKTEAETENLKKTNKEIQARTAKLVAEGDRIKNENKGIIPEAKKIDLTTKYRNEYFSRPQVKKHYELQDAFNKLTVSSDDGVGDLGAIFNFMKMIDPGVAVMEGDVKNVTNTSGLMGYLASLYEIKAKGRALPEGAQKKLQDQARKYFAVSKKGLEKEQSSWRAIAKRQDLNIDDILMPTEEGFKEVPVKGDNKSGGNFWEKTGGNSTDFDLEFDPVTGEFK